MELKRYIPAGSAKVEDRHSDAVAYAYTTKDGLPAAIVYCGRREKSVWHHRFSKPEVRERHVAAFFEARRSHAKFKAEQAAKRAAQGRGLDVGDIVYTSWGYEQTNTEFFQITALIGKAMVELREIAQAREDSTCWMQWRATPEAGRFVGEPIRRVAKAGSVRIDDVRHAWKWDGRPKHCSGYA